MYTLFRQLFTYYSQGYLLDHFDQMSKASAFLEDHAAFCHRTPSIYISTLHLQVKPTLELQFIGLRKSMDKALWLRQYRLSLNDCWGQSSGVVLSDSSRSSANSMLFTMNKSNGLLYYVQYILCLNSVAGIHVYIDQLLKKAISSENLHQCDSVCPQHNEGPSK